MSTQTVKLQSNEFQPKNEYILVKPDKIGEQTTESGIVFSLGGNSVLDRPTSGEVIAVGLDIEDIKDGDFVLWPSTDGLEIDFIDGEFFLLRYKSIIGSKKK